jgi:hypothetical protein
METEESRKKCGATPKSNLGLVKKNQKRKDHMVLYFCHEELERSVVSLLSFSAF